MSMDRCNCGRMVDTDFDLSFYDTDPPPHEGVRVTFPGALSGRWSELEFLRPVVEAMVTRHESVRFFFTGAMPAWALPLPRVFSVAWCPVPGYFRLMRHLAPDIGLAPLTDNPFNRCKSAIKYYEYAMSGTAGIYTALDGETGIVIPNDPDAWIAACDTLIQDVALRHRLRDNARQDVLAHHAGPSVLGQVLEEVTSYAERRSIRQ